MITPEQRRERMVRNLAEHMDASLVERITAFAHTGIAVDDKNGAGEQLGLSRFGSDALLPPTTTWPNVDTEDQNELAAVIDLAAVGPLDYDGLLPHHGVLNFFTEENGESGQVIHADPGTAVRTAPPEGTKRHEERTLYGRTVLTVPPLEDLEKLAPELTNEFVTRFSNAPKSKEVLNSYTSIAKDDDKSPCANQMGGWPNWAQTSLFYEPGKTHLLFDLQGDGVELTFGDFGSLYFLIEEQDLRSGDLDNAYTIMHSL